MPTRMIRPGRARTIALAALLAAAVTSFGTAAAAAQEEKPPPKAEAGDSRFGLESVLQEGDPKKDVALAEALLLLTALALAPAALALMTSFTRIAIVLSFVRRALAAPDLPPNSILLGLSVLLTVLVMTPTFAAIKRDAVDPYLSAEPERRISREEAYRRAEGHLRTFMFKYARPDDLTLFMDATSQPSKPEGWTENDVPSEVLVPSFVIGELRRAFLMGFALFLPFLIIDVIVAALLASLGMFMMPPTLVSLPFKILLFVLVDGWRLVVGSLIQSFF
ncbi:MAG: flagellar type III secretion system pore protein FliP [Planctomycetes bacterium]|nr:flagellar type III secretion system pore protein FliP [Planctomycetota bacterium]